MLLTAAAAPPAPAPAPVSGPPAPGAPAASPSFPLTRSFVLAPAEGCSLRLQQMSPWGPHINLTDGRTKDGQRMGLRSSIFIFLLIVIFYLVSLPSDKYLELLRTRVLRKYEAPIEYCFILLQLGSFFLNTLK